MCCRISGNREAVKLWTPYEIVLQAAQSYENPYTEVNCWITLKGPSFEKRVYGFWDGGSTFRIRVVASAPGKWTWTSGSDADDSGLNNKTGSFYAEGWSEAEKQMNPFLNM